MKKIIDVNATKETMKSANICRVCSSRGEYDIFSVIPAYLHAGPNEFLHWKKDISTLLEETTGLTVDPNDGLPRQMCALCISYLKHAATFRQQAIDNIISLKAAQTVANTKNIKPFVSDNKSNNKNKRSDKQSVCVSADDLIFSETRKTDTNSLVNNILNNHHKSDEYVKKFLLSNDSKTTASKEKSRREECEKNNLKTYLNLLFEKEINKTPGRSARKRYHKSSSTEAVEFNWSERKKNAENSESMGEEFQTASSDDNEIQRQKLHYFSYKEKNFEEDDITELEIFKEANVIINIPEYCEERKCRACFRRFMFEDSFKEHKEICVEYKFLVFIEEINRLLEIRRNKAVSPHEFIRRMIFFLRKICQWLSTNCGEAIELPDLVVGGTGEVKRVEKCEENRSISENSTTKVKSLNDASNILNGVKAFLSSSSPISTSASEKNDSHKNENPLLDLLRSKADSSILRYDAKTPDPLLELLKSKDSPTPRNKPKFDSISSDSSYACSTIEQNLRLNNEFSKPPKIDNGRKSLLESFNQVAPLSPLIARPIPICTASNQQSSSPSPIYPKLAFSARCSACNTIFETIASLEEHNAKYHNNPAKLEEHKRIIALFEGEDAPNNLEGSVDVIKMLNCNQLMINTNDSSKKMQMIWCSTCDKKFPTIIQLDQHKTKCQMSSKKLIA